THARTGSVDAHRGQAALRAGAIHRLRRDVENLQCHGFQPCRLAAVVKTVCSCRDGRPEGPMSTMESVSALLADYERGRLSRRELLYCLTAVAATPLAGRAQDDVLRAQTLNHVSLIVSNLDR